MKRVTFRISTKNKYFFPKKFVGDDNKRFLDCQIPDHFADNGYFFIRYVFIFLALSFRCAKKEGYSFLFFFFRKIIANGKVVPPPNPANHEIYWRKSAKLGWIYPLFSHLNEFKNHYFLFIFRCNWVHSFQWGIEEARAKAIGIYHSNISSCSVSHNKFSFYWHSKN